MNTIDLLTATRTNILKLCGGLTDEQLNQIPVGFNNNLIWNAGHVIATMESLVYGLGRQQPPSGKDFINRYRKGSKPEVPASEAEIQEIFTLLKTSVKKLEADLGVLDFSNYKEYPTSYGVTLRSVEDALTFNNMHEAMHVGAIIALKKFV
ncbi:DinB family protein [Neolewinella antarctica]|uniref:DinB-like domain-containing protein n=1 Tax=Neolewinella antarctica TaxID=442734 RepID=A0ABX0XES5_9BACT|nr:DinB family protein [Neolewinella antarctica]NJC27288.1 hypothetical protein [Neolewinella antarctica]